MQKLDALDRKLLWELDQNSRQAVSELSRKLRHGRDIVAYRMRRLWSEGVVLRAAAIVDPFQLGYSIYKSYLRLKNKPTSLPKLILVLQKNPAVYCFASTDGHWDLIFNTLARSAFEFEQLFDEIVRPFRESVIECRYAVVLEQHFFSKKFLAQNSAGASWKIGGELGNADSNQRDLAILALLASDARHTVIEIAAKLDLSQIMVRTSIERLEKARVIVGYRVHLNRKLLGLTAFKAQLALRPSADEFLPAILKHANQSPYILSLIRQLGETRVEFNALACSYDIFSASLDEFSKNFNAELEGLSMLIVGQEEFNSLALRAVQRGPKRVAFELAQAQV